MGPQVAPIAARVAELRRLSFDHPVPVRYLTDAEFRKRVGDRESKLTKSDRRKVADLQSTLRAFGLIDADTDIVKSLDAVNGAGVLALLRPDRPRRSWSAGRARSTSTARRRSRTS